MTEPQSTYLGWELLAHRPDCKRPQWEVDVRRGDDAGRYWGRGEPAPKHSCPEEYCRHSNAFTEITVRIVCRSCGRAELITGEDSEDTGGSSTSTAYLGYGLPPRKIAGLYLWPGRPWLDFGRLSSPEPHDFLVTTARVDRVTEADVIGEISQRRGKRGGVLWAVGAVPDAAPRYAYRHVHWTRSHDGLRSIAAAAKWIAAQYADTEGGGSR